MQSIEYKQKLQNKELQNTVSENVVRDSKLLKHKGADIVGVTLNSLGRDEGVLPQLFMEV